MNTVADLLKGMPVLIMRRGLYPNKADIVDITSRFPNHTVRTEVIHQPATRFVVTVRSNHHVR
jgi:hypothetical protein